MWPRCTELLLLCCALLSGCAGVPAPPESETATAGAAAAPAVVIEDVDAAFAESLQLMQTGDWNTAADRLTAITATEPKASGAWTNLGITQVKLGDSAAAETAFRKAIDSNRRQVEAWNQLGMLQRRAGRLEEAAASWQAALEIDPLHADAHWNLAILYDRHQPDPAQALAHYTQYRELTRSDDPQLAQWIAAQQALLPPPETQEIKVTVEKVEVPENITAETDKP